MINIYSPNKEKRKYVFTYSGIESLEIDLDGWYKNSSAEEEKQFGFTALNYDIKHLEIWDNIYPLLHLLGDGGPIFGKHTEAHIHFNFSLNRNVRDFFIIRAKKMGVEIKITADDLNEKVFNISTEGNALAFGGGKDSRLLYGILNEKFGEVETYSAPLNPYPNSTLFCLDNEDFISMGGKNVSPVCRNTIWNRIMPALMSQKRNVFLGGVLGDVELTTPWQQYYDCMSQYALLDFSLLLKDLGIEMNFCAPLNILPHNIIQKILYTCYPELCEYQHSTEPEAESEKNLDVSLCKLYHDIDFTKNCSEELFKRLLENFVKEQTAEPQNFGFRNHRKIINKEMRAIIYHMQDHPLFAEVRSQIPSSWKGRWIDFIHSYTVPDIDSRFMEVYNEYATDIDDHPDSERMMHVNVKN